MKDERTGMIDPVAAGEVLRRYFETASDQQIAEDLRRFSPELAARYGLLDDPVGPEPPRRRGRGFLAAFGRSIHRLFT